VSGNAKDVRQSPQGGGGPEFALFDN